MARKVMINEDVGDQRDGAHTRIVHLRCRMVQAGVDGAERCRMGLDSAEWCRTVQAGAEWCRIVQDGAGRCRLVKYGAG